MTGDWNLFVTSGSGGSGPSQLHVTSEARLGADLSVPGDPYGAFDSKTVVSTPSGRHLNRTGRRQGRHRMSNYLVVAHQTAASDELVSSLKAIAARDRESDSSCSCRPRGLLISLPGWKVRARKLRELWLQKPQGSCIKQG